MDPRGEDDDEWLDRVERKPRARPAEKRPLEGRAVLLKAAEGNATVAELFPNQCAVRLDGQAERVLCGYKMETLVSREGRERSPVCVGDRVKVEGRVIVARCERRNSLVRSAPNARTSHLHAIVANIDVLVVVAAALQPEFSPGIVERFITAAAAQGIPVTVCVNKIDLLEPGAPRPWLALAAPGVTVLECSAKSGHGALEIAALARGKAVAFCGHSGVGKTSLLRRLLGDESIGRVGELSRYNGKGRHTTTGAVLLPGPEGSAWIDTPGITHFTAPAAT